MTYSNINIWFRGPETDHDGSDTTPADSVMDADQMGYARYEKTGNEVWGAIDGIDDDVVKLIVEHFAAQVAKDYRRQILVVGDDGEENDDGSCIYDVLFNNGYAEEETLNLL